MSNIILELGCNHNGSMDNAKRMIDDARRLGVYGIKLQKRDIDSIPMLIGSKQRNSNNSFGTTYYAHRRALEFSYEQIQELKQHTEDRGLTFACSVFDTKSILMLVQMGVIFIKLPSQFFTDVVMNETLDRFSNKIIKWHSTGMHTTQEILDSMYLRYGFQVTFYCRSIYPHDETQIDIGSAIAIYRTLGQDYHKGYSSHDKDGKLIPVMVSLGASWIERHYTLDKNMKGSDHATVSSDFAEMQTIIQRISAMEECQYANKLSDQEQVIRDTYIVRKG